MIFTLWLMGKDDFSFLNFIFPRKNMSFAFWISFFPQKKWFLLCEFHFSLVILPSCSKLCQSSKRQCGFVSPHATCCFWVVFFLSSHFLCLFVCVCLKLCLLFLFFVCCSCSFFVALVLLFVVPVLCLLFLFFVCCSCSLFVVLVLCLLFLFFVLLVWWFVLFPKRLRVGIQRPQWGKKHLWRLSKRLVVLTYIGGLSFFSSLSFWGGWGNVVAWSFYMLITPLFSQPHMFHVSSIKRFIWHNYIIYCTTL